MDEQEHLRVIHDQELSDIFLKLKAQDNLLQAIHLTQSEHTATFAKQTAILEQHTATLEQHTATLDRHTATLDRHTATLDRHTAILERHTAMHRETNATLAKHTVELYLLKDGMERIVGMLDTLIERGNPQ